MMRMNDQAMRCRGGAPSSTPYAERAARARGQCHRLVLLLMIACQSPWLPLRESVAAPPAEVSPVEANPVEANPVDAGPSVPADAPAWVRQRPDRVDGDPARVVLSDPCETRPECDEDLRGKVERVLQAYAMEHLQDGRRVDAQPIDVSAQLVRSCVRESYASTHATSLGTMHEVYQLIVLDANVRAQLEDRMRRRDVHRRLGNVAWASVSVAAVVALLHGQLRYRARRVAHPLAIHPPA